MFKRFLCILLSLMLAAGMTAALAEEPAAEEKAPAAEAEAPAAEAEAPAAEAEAPAAEAEAPAAEEEAPAGSEEPVLLLTVNGKEIYDDDYGYNYFIEYYLDMMAQYGLTEGVEDYQTYFDLYKGSAIPYAIQQVFYKEKADELNLKVTDEERAEQEKTLREEWQSAVASYVADAGITDASTEEERQAAVDEALTVFKEQYGYTEESFVEAGLKEFDYYTPSTKVYEEMTKDVTVTDEELQAHFNDLVKEDEESYKMVDGDEEASSSRILYYEYMQQMGTPVYYVPEGYRGVTHILLKVDDELMKTYQDLTSRFAAEQEKANAPEETEETVEQTDSTEPELTPEPTEAPEPVTQEMIDQAKQAIFDSVQGKIDEIRSKFEAGTPFEDLIAEYGEDPGMKIEETLHNGYVIHPYSMNWDPAFISGAMSIANVGEISEPVLGKNGIHIIYYLRDVPSGAIEMTDAMRQELTETLLEENKGDYMKAQYDAWMEKADIQYTAEGQAIRDAASAAQAKLEAEAASTENAEEADPEAEEATPETGEAAPEAEEAAPETEAAESEAEKPAE